MVWNAGLTMQRSREQCSCMSLKLGDFQNKQCGVNACIALNFRNTVLSSVSLALFKEHSVLRTSRKVRKHFHIKNHHYHFLEFLVGNKENRHRGASFAIFCRFLNLLLSIFFWLINNIFFFFSRYQKVNEVVISSF